MPVALRSLFVCTSVFASFALVSGALSPVHAQDTHCSATSGGRTPITDLGPNLYNGFAGGLYPGGSNVRPAGHEAAGLLVANQIEPLNSQGQVDTTNGHIGFVSIGMSLTNQEFEVFEFAANVDVNRNPRVTMVNGAQSGLSAFQWSEPDHPAWTELARIVATKSLSSSQIQVAWIKLTIRGTDVGDWSNFPFPANAALFQTKLRAVVQILKARYPNIRIAYLSSRVYGGYAAATPYPEPMAYEEGFGVKWLIEDQINGDPTLAYAGSSPSAPYLAWGPYIWADGLGADNALGGIPGRSDGLEYSCQDFEGDGLHPSPSGRQKVASQLLQFVNADTTAQLWYRNPNPPPQGGTPYYLSLDGANDYLTVPDHNSLSFGNGAADTPLTFELWFRPTTMTGKQNLVSKWLDGSNLEYRLYTSSGLIRFDMRDSSAQATVSVYTGNQSSLIGTWHHLAVTYDGRGGAMAAAGVTFYIDGVAVPVTRVNNPSYVAMENWTTALQIGRESSSYQQYNGALDEIRLWNVVRTQAQIQLNRAFELDGTESGLTAYWRLNEGIGATVADDSPADHTAVMFNNPTWVAGGPMEPPSPDTTSPVISNILASNLTDSEITVNFDTNEPTTGWVSFTPNTSCPCTDVFSPVVATHHVVRLTGLAPDTSYIFEAKALDAAGNFQVGLTFSFRTLATPPDSTPPVVSITSPTASTVMGIITISASATDNIRVAGVQFRLNGVNLGAEDLTSPYSITWDSTSVVDGPYTLTAHARDDANNIRVATLAINVQNTTPVSSAYFVSFDGANDHMTVPDANSLSFGNGAADTPLTFELWFRPTTMTGKQNLVSKWLDGSNLEYRLYTSSGLIRFDMRDSSAQATVSVYTGNQSSLIGTWHHLAVTYDGRGGAMAAAGVTFYIDGVAVPVTRANNPSYVAMENWTTALQIGRESSSYQQYQRSPG